MNFYPWRAPEAGALISDTTIILEICMPSSEPDNINRYPEFRHCQLYFEAKVHAKSGLFPEYYKIYCILSGIFRIATLKPDCTKLSTVLYEIRKRTHTPHRWIACFEQVSVLDPCL